MQECGFCQFDGYDREASSSLGDAEDPDLAGRPFVRLSKELLITPTLGPLHPGHLLLLPRHHVTSFVEIGASKWAATSRVAREARNQLANYWRRHIVVFEHGVGQSGGGCGVDHAHLHLVPASKAPNLSPLGYLAWSRTTDTRWLADAFPMRDGYFYVSLSPTEHYLASVQSPESQTLRRWLAEETGVAEWDWRSSEASTPKNALFSTQTMALETFRQDGALW